MMATAFEIFEAPLSVVTTNTGISEYRSTFSVWEPKRPRIPRRDWDAMQTRSQPFSFAAWMIASKGGRFLCKLSWFSPRLLAPQSRLWRKLLSCAQQIFRQDLRRYCGLGDPFAPYEWGETLICVEKSNFSADFAGKHYGLPNCIDR